MQGNKNQEEQLHNVEAHLRSGLHIREREDELRRRNEAWELRRKAATRLLWMFLAANAVSLAALIVAWLTDYSMNASSPNYLEHRIFDKDVLIALLAATTVQLGAAALVIAKWLFPEDQIK